MKTKILMIVIMLSVLAHLGIVYYSPPRSNEIHVPTRHITSVVDLDNDQDDSDEVFADC